MTIRVLLRDQPHRAVALATDSHVLTFRHSSSAATVSTSSLSLQQSGTSQPQCMVEFSAIQEADLSDFRSLTSLSIQGTLGLVTINNDVFLCVVNGASRVATVRPGENIQRITSVEFRKYRRDLLAKVHLTQFRLYKQVKLRCPASRPDQPISNRLTGRGWFRSSACPACN